MMLQNENAELFLTDANENESAALGRITHLAVGAHQDDVEIMAGHGIIECIQCPDKTFGAVVVTDGGGSPRSGVYANYSDDEMKSVRANEQKKAAVIGQYAVAALLGYPSSAVKDPLDRRPVTDLAALIEAARPEIVYTHNLTDKHDTHVAVALRTIDAVRSLPVENRPDKVVGCEVWRDLDWLDDDEKVVLDCSGHQNLQAALLGVYDSQIAGGQRYDLAVAGRRQANATFFASHDVDKSTALTFAMDLTPLIQDPDCDPITYVLERIDHFRNDAERRMRNLTLVRKQVGTHIEATS